MASHPERICPLGMVQMHLTVPHHQQGPALSCFAALSISVPIETDPSLRGGVTRGDCSNGQVLFFKLNLALIFNRCSGCALHYPFLAMICNHMRGTSVMPSSWHTWYTVVPSAAAPSASGTPGKAPWIKSR
jgi:hypothetical protein